MTSPGKIRIMLVDDHRVVLAGLKRLLDDCAGMEVVCEAASHGEALAGSLEHRPDVVLLDIRLPGPNGFETCREIKKRLPLTKVVILTSAADDAMVLEAIQAGAEGYLLKEIDAEELEAAVRKAAGGGVLFDPSVTRGIIQSITRPGKAANPLEQLTGRERRLLEAVASGKTNRQIAEEFHLSEGTVRNYLSVAFEKMGVSRRAQAVASYLKACPPSGKGV